MFLNCPATLKRSLSSCAKCALGLLLLAPLTASLGFGQSHPTPPPVVTPPSNPTPPPFTNSKSPDYGPPPERTPTFEDLQYRRYVMGRLRSMVSDSDKMFKLERELSAKIDKSGPGSLTRDDLRTMAEIEKLAHNIKWKMQLATDQSHAP